MNKEFEGKLREKLDKHGITMRNISKSKALILEHSGVSLRVRATNEQILYTELKTSDYDYLIGSIKNEEYVLLKHDSTGKVVDFYKKTEILTGESTTLDNCTKLNLDNLVGALLVIYSL